MKLTEKEEELILFLRELEDSYAPWEETDLWKNKSQFMTWVRGKLRGAIWSKWPLKNELKRDKRYPVSEADNPEGWGRTKFLIDCELCGKPEGVSKIEVDHISPAGSLIDYTDLTFFFFRLLCSKDNMRLLDKECHALVTLSDKKGITIEQARIEKQVTSFTKLDVAKQKKLLQDAGFSLSETSNAAKRKKLYKEIVED